MNQCWVPESTFVFFSWWKTVTNPLQLLVFSSKEKISLVGNQSTASKKLSWKWKVVPEPWNRPGFLASREEFNLGPEMRLDRSELLYNKVLLKYKRDRESFWHRHQKGAERVPPCYSLAMCYIATSKLLIIERRYLKLRVALGIQTRHSK